MNLVEIGDVIVGFRPEQFRPAALVSESNKVPLRFRVENVEYLGSEWIVSGVLAGGRAEGKKALARLASAQAFTLGQTYDFAWGGRGAYIFYTARTKPRAARTSS